jgi:hypothetical protein
MERGGESECGDDSGGGSGAGGGAGGVSGGANDATATVGGERATSTGSDAELNFAKITVAVYSTATLGLFALFFDVGGPASTSVEFGESRALAESSLLDRLLEANPSNRLLQTRFTWPGERGREIVYNVHAPKRDWVIVSVGGRKVARAAHVDSAGRRHGSWPICAGDVPGFNFLGDRSGCCERKDHDVDTPTTVHSSTPLLSSH